MRTPIVGDWWEDWGPLVIFLLALAALLGIILANVGIRIFVAFADIVVGL